MLFFGQDYRIAGFTGLIKSNTNHCLIKHGQDYRIYRINTSQYIGVRSNIPTCCFLDRITGFTGLKSNAKHCLVKNGQDYRIWRRIWGTRNLILKKGLNTMSPKFFKYFWAQPLIQNIILVVISNEVRDLKM